MLLHALIQTVLQCLPPSGRFWWAEVPLRPLVSGFTKAGLVLIGLWTALRDRHPAHRWSVGVVAIGLLAGPYLVSWESTRLLGSISATLSSFVLAWSLWITVGFMVRLFCRRVITLKETTQSVPGLRIADFLLLSTVIAIAFAFHDLAIQSLDIAASRSDSSARVTGFVAWLLYDTVPLIPVLWGVACLGACSKKRLVFLAAFSWVLMIGSTLAFTAYVAGSYEVIAMQGLVGVIAESFGAVLGIVIAGRLLRWAWYQLLRVERL